MKKLFTMLICLSLMLTLLPLAAFASGVQESIIAEATSTFVTDEEAFDGDLIKFWAIADGKVTVTISDCSPGYYMEFYENGNWESDYYGASANVVTMDVTEGMAYELIISSYDVTEECQVKGSISYQIKSSVVTTEEETPDPVPPLDEAGGSADNPLHIGNSHNMYIDAGQTVWFAYANSDATAKMLNINGRTTYSVDYNGTKLPVDQDGYVNYLLDPESQYAFSITNSSTYKVYFTISLANRTAYVNTGISLVLGDNNLSLSEDATNSLYEFTPAQTGEYLFVVDKGVIGNWGTTFNPVDNTAQKGNSLRWTCTSVGQSVLVGVANTTNMILNVKRTADYIPPTQVPWVYYDFTYDFSYEIPYDAELVDIDVTDSLADIAVLDRNGFYRYGSANGPLMVADLSNVEINILDAYEYGQLRAYIYDDNGEVISRIDYNEAMYEYALYGLAPLTKELATMIKQVGDTQSWWAPSGFVFQDTSPLDKESAWMAFCSYVKGSELANGSGNQNNGGNTITGSDTHSKPSGEGSGSPGTGDLSFILPIAVMLISSAGLIVLLNHRKRIV